MHIYTIYNTLHYSNFLKKDWVVLYSPDWPVTSYINQAGLKLMTVLMS